MTYQIIYRQHSPDNIKPGSWPVCEVQAQEITSSTQIDTLIAELERAKKVLDSLNRLSQE